MEATKVSEYARALYSAHGDKAEAEVARKARESETAGKMEEAETWRAIRRAVSRMRGPHVS